MVTGSHGGNPFTITKYGQQMAAAFTYMNNKLLLHFKKNIELRAERQLGHY
jgi:hypothetical protein